MDDLLRKRWLQVAAAPAIFGCLTALADDGPNSSIYSNRLNSMRMQLARQQQSTTAPESLPPPIAAIAAGSPQSWYEVPLPPVKEAKENDIVTIRVDMGSRFNSDAQMQRRKTSSYDAVLKDWVFLQGLRGVYPDPQTRGEPRVRGEMNETYRALGDLDSTESLRFEIAAKVASVLPNGTLVIEARNEVEVNDERWLIALTGVVRREDIQPGNLVLSKDIADMRIKKRELGQVYDSYKRGWARRWLDTFAPF
jgi:flagellar L-ring protein precursor FlgH